MNAQLSRYRILGLAIAAVVANVGINFVRDPSFSLKQAALLAGLCIVVTIVVFQAVSAAEILISRWRKV